MSPERVLGSNDNIKSDIWSFGIVAAELCLDCHFFPKYKNAQLLRKILSLCNNANILEKLAREHDRIDKYNVSESFFSLIKFNKII